MSQDTAQTSQTPAKDPTPSPPSSPSLGKFVDEMIKAKNFPQDLDEAVKKQIKKDLLVRVNDFINAKLIAALAEKDIEEFEKLLDKKEDVQEVQKFFERKIPDFPSFLTGIFLDFRRTYLGIV